MAETKDLEERLVRLELSLGLPKTTIATKLAVETAEKRKALFAPKESAAATELARGIKSLAKEKGLLAEFSLWEIDPEGHPRSCCCCCCCC